MSWHVFRLVGYDGTALPPFSGAVFKAVSAGTAPDPTVVSAGTAPDPTVVSAGTAPDPTVVSAGTATV